MDSRKLLKQKAKENIKHHFFRNVILVFIASVLMSGGYIYSTKDIFSTDNEEAVISIINEKQEKKSNAEIVNELLKETIDEKEHEEIEEKNKYTNGVLSVLFNEITISGSFIFGILNVINKYIFSGEISVLILTILGLGIIALTYIFVGNVMVIGKNRYFLEQRRYNDTKIDKLLFPYRIKKTLHLSYILLIKNIYQLLWSFTIIGGFIKHYTYLMIPYVLAENPNITKDEAFELSKEMMDGHKMEVFKLDVSLIGWKILGAFTYNLSNIFYYNVYRESLFTELYMNIRNEKINKLEKGYLLNDHLLAIKERKNFSYPQDKFSIPISKRRKWLNIDYAKNYSFTTYILFFFSFSFIGWIWEVLFHLVSDGVFVNRGTMFGPWLPIYGVGGCLILFLFKPFREKHWLIFLLSFILCGIIEYSTAWYLETFKHMKWWDYSGYFLNIKGRICMEGLLVFGLGGCIFTYILAPIFDNLYEKVKPKIKVVLCIVLISCFAIDFLYSLKYPNSGEGITNSITYTDVNETITKI